MKCVRNLTKLLFLKEKATATGELEWGGDLNQNISSTLFEMNDRLMTSDESNSDWTLIRADRLGQTNYCSHARCHWYWCVPIDHAFPGRNLPPDDTFNQKTLPDIDLLWHVGFENYWYRFGKEITVKIINVIVHNQYTMFIDRRSMVYDKEEVEIRKWLIFWESESNEEKWWRQRSNDLFKSGTLKNKSEQV